MKFVEFGKSWIFPIMPRTENFYTVARPRARKSRYTGSVYRLIFSRDKIRQQKGIFDMNYTQNYQLPQWVETDRILMEDFNDAFDTIESAMSGFGNCQVYTTSYVGTNRFGSSDRNTLTFP